MRLSKEKAIATDISKRNVLLYLRWIWGGMLAGKGEQLEVNDGVSRSVAIFTVVIV
jgi:hypothetical protein